MRPRLVRWLLYLFPRPFRAAFEDEVLEYVAVRRAETTAAGRWTRAVLTLRMTADLLVAAVQCRARAIRPARLAWWAGTMSAGLLAGGLLLSTALILFERLVRSPLLAIAKTNGGLLDGAVWLGSFAAVVLVLFRWYVSLLPPPDKRRHPAQ